MHMVEDNECYVYLYDGSFEGLLTAVFMAWNDRAFKDIRVHENLRPGFFDRNIYVETDIEKAERVSRWIQTKISEAVGNDIYEYFTAEAPEREKIIYFYLRACNRYGPTVNDYLTDPAVLNYVNAQKPIGRERQRMLGFVRFRELGGEVLFSEISTDFNQLMYLGAFFFDRMTGIPWMIYDSARHKAAVSNGKQWTLVEYIVAESIKEKCEGDDFDVLWKNYLQALTIDERKNRRLQVQMLPLKYRKNMTEFL